MGSIDGYVFTTYITHVWFEINLLTYLLTYLSYMLVMGFWHPQKNPDVPGPVPASSCHSCMSCKYCFPEDRLPPE